MRVPRHGKARSTEFVKPVLAVAVVLLASLAASPAAADFPLPHFSDASPAVLVREIPGVVERGSLQTVAICTVTGSSPTHMALEVFAPDGTRLNDVAANEGVALSVATGNTVTFGTGGTGAFLESVILPVMGVNHGYARVVASSPEVRCSVLVLDGLGRTPASVARLTAGLRPLPGPRLAGQQQMPTFSDGTPASYAALLAGVTKRLQMETVITCSSLATAPIEFGVQIVGAEGALRNDVALDNGTALSVPPGNSVTFATSGTAAFLENPVIRLGSIPHGTARVVTTSPDVSCVGLLVDQSLSPPTSFAGLPGSGCVRAHVTPACATPAIGPAVPSFPDGTPAVVVLDIPGIIERATIDSVVTCTVTGASPAHIGLEVFGVDGVALNDIHAGRGVVSNVPAGGTATIGTGAISSFSEGVDLAVNINGQGYGRVLASSPEVRCAAFAADPASTPPASLTELPAGRRLLAGAQWPGRPLPIFSNGHPATHAALIPGVAKRRAVETAVFCTSLADTTIDVGVEFFGRDGSLRNDVATGNGVALGLAPGATVTFGTTGTAALLENSVVRLTGISQGFARVVATSPDVTCAAVLIHETLAPPTFMAALEVAGCGTGYLNPACGATPSATPSPTLPAAPSSTATATATASRTNIATSSPTGTSTATPSRTPTQTFSATATRTRTPTAPATATASGTNTAISSPTGTSTATPSRAPTQTFSATATRTRTPTTAAATLTPSRTPTEPPLPTATRIATVPPCVGDCSGNARVTVDELILGVNISLRGLAIDTCPAFDRNDDGRVTIDELVTGVKMSLEGCPAQATLLEYGVGSRLCRGCRSSRFVREHFLSHTLFVSGDRFRNVRRQTRCTSRSLWTMA